MKYVITEAQLTEIVRRTVNKVMLSESKQDDLAKQYLKNKGYSMDQILKIRGELLRQVPNLKLDNRKFLLAAVRYACNRELTDNHTYASFDKALKLIHDGGHTNEYDYDLNGLDLETLTTNYRDIAKQVGDEDRIRSANRRFVGGTDYIITPITSFEEAQQYGNYTSWCVTQDSGAFKKYTKVGEKFYFCLRSGFQNVPETKGPNAPLDDYGLSMVSVLVDAEGDLSRVTTRWNHSFGGENHPQLSTTEQLEDLFNVNFYNTFKPYTKEELLAKGIVPFYMVPELLEQGVPLENIFEYIRYLDNGNAKVELNDKFNILSKNNTLVFKQWFNTMYDFVNGYAKVKSGEKWNFIDTNGKLVFDMWFDVLNSFKNGYAKVKSGEKWNFIDTNGKLVSDMWFDDTCDFQDGYARVQLGEKWNFIDTNGKLVSNMWFDNVGFLGFKNGYARVQLGEKWNFIDINGKFISDMWFDGVGWRGFDDGHAEVWIGKTRYTIDTNGKLNIK